MAVGLENPEKYQVSQGFCFFRIFLSVRIFETCFLRCIKVQIISLELNTALFKGNRN